MEKPAEPAKKRPDIVILAVGSVAVIALAVWAATWMWPAGEEGVTKPEAAAKTADGLPPMRALPPPGTDLLPPLRTPPRDTPAAPAPQAAAPVIPPTGPAKVAPALPVTPAPPKAEKTAPAAPPVQTTRRPEMAPGDSAPGGLPGRYVGNISGSEGGGLTLVIASAEGGVVRGTASLTGGGVCDDNYPMQGSTRSGKLDLRATKMGGRANDCPLALSLAVDGNRMTGTTGTGGAVQLTKR